MSHIPLFLGDCCSNLEVVRKLCTRWNKADLNTNDTQFLDSNCVSLVNQCVHRITGMLDVSFSELLNTTTCSGKLTGYDNLTSECAGIHNTAEC